MAICCEYMIENICEIKNHKLLYFTPCTNNVSLFPLIQDCMFENTQFFFKNNKKNPFVKNEA